MFLNGAYACLGMSVLLGIVASIMYNNARADSDEERKPLRK
jgi:hypothetical protein